MVEKPNSIKQKEAYAEVRKKILDVLKQLSDESNDESTKEACKSVAKDVVEAPDIRFRLEWFQDIARRDREDEDWEAMM